MNLIIEEGPAYIFGTAMPNDPGTVSYLGHETNKIYLSDFATNDNGDGVTYAIYFEEYNSAGTVTDSGYIQQSDGSHGAEDWQTAATWGSRITFVTGGTYISYRFKVKARSEDTTQTTPLSAFSVYMSPYITLDLSPASNVLAYECTTGKCKVSAFSITMSGATATLHYMLTRINTPATKNNIKVFMSHDGTNYDHEITSSIGTVTNLTASVSGTVYPNISVTNTWQTWLTLGTSYHGTVYLKIYPYDESTGGAIGEPETTSIAIDNRPLAITIVESEGHAWDKAQYPIIRANMADYVYGTALYFLLEIRNAAGTLIQNLSSAEVTTGWAYEKTNGGGWNIPDYHGVDHQYAPPDMTGNRIQYTIQTALAQGNTYSFKMYQAEAVNVLV